MARQIHGVVEYPQDFDDVTASILTGFEQNEMTAFTTLACDVESE